MHLPKQKFLLALCLFITSVSAFATDQFINFQSQSIAKSLCTKGSQLTMYVSDKDNIAVKLAAKNLANDFNAVCDANVTFSTDASNCNIIAGTLGQSEAIDKMAKAGEIDIKQLKGKTEKYLLIARDGKIVIAGSDRRGTVYGIYELSRQIGVSPWYYWMDTPIKKQEALYVKDGVYTDGEPSVRYRGIFLNDEAPCLTSWVKNTFGTNYGGHKFYEKVFELVLRLKGNYIWPAMWSWAFYADDPLNGETANNMGVMIGTSHHEPMSRSQKEWHGHSDDPNQDTQDIKSRQEQGGKWDYSTNKANLDKFWLGGVERNKNTEDIITIGMRGDGDMAMSEERNVKLLESVIENQRKLISKARGTAAKNVPQLWALYKEVMDYYDDGMRVPDDVIMLLCDDNWGNVRRVPTAKERKHKGGWGLYYHVDYVGAPRNSKLLNVTPTQNMVEQLSLAYNYGIDKLWILNVGDLKPMEYPIQVFMDMAWNINDESFVPQANAPVLDVMKHTEDFCASIFGEAYAKEAARILNACCKMNGRSTAEMLDAKTYNLQSGEWQEVVDEYKTLEIEALRLYNQIPSESRDAYFQLILFPVQLMTNLHQMYYAQAMNNALHERNDAAMNVWADKCESYFKRDAELMRQYNKDIANGKWDGMMTQKHIGYKSWNDSFRQDMLPKLYRTDSIENIYLASDNTVTGQPCAGYIAIEAEHFNSKQEPSSEGRWTVIPDMGRTLSGMTLMPQTADVSGAALKYRFNADLKGGKLSVRVITKSTLDFFNKKGMTYSVSIDGGEPITVNFNSNLNEDPENIYSIYYPTVARRIVEKVVEIPTAGLSGTEHTLTFVPNDPGIVLEKLIIDFGGYKPQFLFGKESLRK